MPDKSGIKIPIHYNYIIQSAIYNSISKELGDFLHKTGYCYRGRVFKLFAYSRLLGNYKIDRTDNTIFFTGPVKLIISSPVNIFCESLVNTLLTKGYITIMKRDVHIKNIFIRKVLAEKEELRVRTLSPIVCYSTLLRPDGRKYTCYFQPGETDFNNLIRNNITKKYKAFYGLDEEPGKFSVFNFSRKRMHVIKYKNTVIKAYSCNMTISSTKEIIEFIVSSGLGSKNSQGFGCIDAC